MINSIIFDLGAVLIDWNPQYLYKKIYPDEKDRQQFLGSVCTPEWNEEQDGGRSLKEGTDWLLARYPEQAAAIRAFYDRWEEMLGGPIQGTVEVLEALKKKRSISFVRTHQLVGRNLPHRPGTV